MAGFTDTKHESRDLKRLSAQQPLFFALGTECTKQWSLQHTGNSTSESLDLKSRSLQAQQGTAYAEV